MVLYPNKKKVIASGTFIPESSSPIQIVTGFRPSKIFLWLPTENMPSFTPADNDADILQFGTTLMIMYDNSITNNQCKIYSESNELKGRYSKTNVAGSSRITSINSDGFSYQGSSSVAYNATIHYVAIA